MNLLIEETTYKYREIFSEFGYIKTFSPETIANINVKKFDILIVRSTTKVNAELLANSNIKFVGSTVAGLDHIDQNYLKEKNIFLASAQGCNANSVAEYVISAIVNLSVDYKFNLKNKNLAIIGFGNVGTKLNMLAQQLGIKTILNDPPRQKKEANINFVSLDEALQADIISFHTPLTFNGDNPTYNLLGKHNFHLIKKDAILINTARGGIINENIWQKTQTKANIIDCWQDEPKINKKLQKSAYWATPHIAGHSINAKYMGSYMIYKALCAFHKKQQNDNIANFLKIEKKIIKEKTLRDTLNAIHCFAQDSKVIADATQFNNYRKNYPQRYEWQHFDTSCKIPKIL